MYHFKNIIAYQVDNYTINDGENKGRQDIKNIGSGSGYYFSDGYMIPIKWKKDSRSSQTKYTYEDGTELKVNDGNTFIQIVPSSGSIKAEYPPIFIITTRDPTRSMRPVMRS